MAKRKQILDEGQRLCEKCGGDNWAAIRYKKTTRWVDGREFSGWEYRHVECRVCDMEDVIKGVLLEHTEDHPDATQPPDLQLQVLDMKLVRDLWPKIKQVALERADPRILEED